jgi:hypothetical protein
MAKKEVIKQAFSKQPVTGYVWGSNTQSVFPDFDLNQIYRLINEDTTASGALQHFVDKFMEGDYAILKKDTKQYAPSEEDTLEEDFKLRNEVLRKLAIQGKLWKNAFIEIVRSGNNTKAINVVDATMIEPVTHPNGDPIFYKVKPTAGAQQEVTWNTNEMIWVKFNDMSRGYSPIVGLALARIIYAKQFVTRFVSWLFETGQYRVAYNLKNSSKKNVDDFIAYNSKVSSNWKQPLLSSGEFQAQVLRDMKELSELQNLLKYYDSQILILMRVPPIDAGIPDASGRSNADAQSNNFGTHITSMKKVIEDAINYDLFPKVNRSNTLLRFAPNDRFAEKQAFEVAQMMQAMQMKPQVIREYLFDRGVVFKQEQLFLPREQPISSENPRSLDNMPSRQGKGSGEGNKPQEEVSTRPDQLSKQ